MEKKAHSCDGWSVCFLMIALSLLVAPVSPAAEEQGRQKWQDGLRQKPEWYGTGAALRVAENVLLYQRETGGWPKNIDMTAPLGEREKAGLFQQRKRESTIDNGATYSQMIFLARVYSATRQERFRKAFVRALDALLEAQYGHGGWPQVFPNATGYAGRITFNDGAMIGVMTLLRDVARGERDYRFVDAKRRAKAAGAVEKGVECILNCQIVVDGEKTVWCAQHDEKTLQPAPARVYEKVSLSGDESVGIVRFLMEIERPGPKVVAAVQAAMAWFDRVKLVGIRLVNRPDPSLPKGYDRMIVADPDRAAAVGAVLRDRHPPPHLLRPRRHGEVRVGRDRARAARRLRVVHPETGVAASEGVPRLAAAVGAGKERAGGVVPSPRARRRRPWKESLGPCLNRGAERSHPSSGSSGDSDSMHSSTVTRDGFRKARRRNGGTGKAGGAGRR